MHFQRLTPFRGLLAGLLALVAFASPAVAMTAGVSGSDIGSLTQALPVQTIVEAAGSEIRGAVGRDGHEARFAVSRDADDGERQGDLSGDRRRDHR